VVCPALGGVQGELITHPAELEALAPAWDRLAVTCGRPYAAPAWQLGWWRRAAPPGARPLVLVARDCDEVAGVLALFGQAGRSGLERLRVMGAPMAQGTGPLALPGREAQAARAFAQALAQVRRPRPATLELEGVLEGRRWAALLGDGWPRGARPAVLRGAAVLAPLARLGAPSLDAWLATRSANFRQQLRRSRRRLESRGASFRRVDGADEIAALLPAFVALHEGRWRERGGSRAVGADTQPVLAEVAAALDGTARLTMELVEVEGRPVSAHLFLAAGEETTYWLGGFDEAYAADKPGLVALLEGVEHALGRGATRLDLGPGDQPYKRRFADAERELHWLTLVLPGPRRAVTRLQLAPRRLARAARDRALELRER
jgi:CelD/BcsL family acetyltransferase involved in cellulose biosynthesis